MERQPNGATTSPPSWAAPTQPTSRTTLNEGFDDSNQVTTDGIAREEFTSIPSSHLTQQARLSLLGDSDDELIIEQQTPRKKSPRRKPGDSLRDRLILDDDSVLENADSPRSDDYFNTNRTPPPLGDDDDDAPAVGNKVLLYVAMVSFSVRISFWRMHLYLCVGYEMHPGCVCAFAHTRPRHIWS